VGDRASGDRLVDEAHGAIEGAQERSSSATADRDPFAQRRASAAIAALTGTRARAAGSIDLDHELDRCRRTARPLVLAYVDVVGPGTLEDVASAGARHELLTRIVMLIDEHVRSYDLIIRLGADELVCAMSTTAPADARRRFGVIDAALAAASGPGAIRTGFAALMPGETAAALIARALVDVSGDHDNRSRPAEQPTTDRA
jgi:GGDEF domain-containing protein